MEYLGVLAFILVIVNIGLPNKMNKLCSRMLRLEKTKRKTEGRTMSEILKGLVGERCSLKESDGLVNYVGTVLAVDDEWIKLSIVDKNNGSVVIKRIEDINQISIISK
jgi:hypothetical protein